MLKPGMMLCDRYEILEVVGAGGMSIVYKARCHRLNRNVAIKVLKPEFSNDKNFVTKFKIEAQASAGLTHPNIVNVYDVYDDEGMYFIVMELVDGITLKEYIEQNGRIGMEKALDFSIQIAAGLEAAHESHIIHRDIKPQNIIVAKNGNIKVTDFGIAKAASSNTLTSGAMGSVHYISPEQARGGYSDERSDIYSLGITMYEMVTGRVPFEGDNNVSVALMHIQSDMIPPRQYYPDIYSSFEKIIQKATQKKPERRYLTASALIADLKRVQNNPNIDIVVAPTSITNSPTQEWTKEDVKAIRDGSAYKESHDNGYDSTYRSSAYGSSQLNAFNNPPIQNEMGELRPTDGISMIPVNNKRINQLLNEDPWEEELDEEPQEEPQPHRGSSIKRVQDYEEEEDYEDNDSEIEPGLKKAVMIAGIATAVIIAIVVLIILGSVMGWFKFGKKDKDPSSASDTEQSNEVAMIEVTGYSEDAAVKMLKNLGFVNVETVLEANEDVPEGYVFEQNFKKDDMVDINEKIVLKVSAGAETKEVPSVVGYTDEQAVRVLEEAGFHVVHAYEFDEQVEKDKIIKQEPEAGLQAPMGSDVVITVSNGSEIKEVAVPNLQNLSEAQAINQLNNAKLGVGATTHAYDETVPAGNIISQNPTSGTTVKEGTTVDYVISDGPEPKAATYTANISGTVTCGDPNLDGQAVTIQVRFNDETVSEQSATVISGEPISISGVKRGLAEQSGTASVVILDASGNNITGSFSPALSTSYAAE